jgi:hypothetical protein
MRGAAAHASRRSIGVMCSSTRLSDRAAVPAATRSTTIATLTNTEHTKDLMLHSPTNMPGPASRTSEQTFVHDSAPQGRNAMSCETSLPTVDVLG